MDEEFEELGRLDQNFQQEAERFAGRQVFRRRPKQAKQIIGQLMAKKGFNQNESLQEIRTTWESMMDERLKGKSLAAGIRGGKLIVVVQNAVVNQELSIAKAELLKKLRNTPIGNRIKDIRFQVGVF